MSARAATRYLRRGVTLIEVLITLAIVAVIAGLALISMAGQMIVWKRLMSLPTMWRSAGHHLANASGSSGKPAPVM